MWSFNKTERTSGRGHGDTFTHPFKVLVGNNKAYVWPGFVYTNANGRKYDKNDVKIGSNVLGNPFTGTGLQSLTLSDGVLWLKVTFNAAGQFDNAVIDYKDPDDAIDTGTVKYVRLAQTTGNLVEQYLYDNVFVEAEPPDRGFRITQSDATHVKVSAGTIIDMVGQDFTIADPTHDGDGLWQGSPAVPGKLGRRVEIEESDPIGVDDGSIVWLKLRYTGIDGASDGYTTGGTVSTGLELSGDNVVMSVKMAMATSLLLGVDYVVTGSGDPLPTDSQEAQHIKFAIIGITDDVMSIRPLLPEGTMVLPGVMYPYIWEVSIGEA